MDDTPSRLGGMARYHLGWTDEAFQPLSVGAIDRGKRLRPALAILVCEALGGKAETAAPLAAGIELLHNFTLVHDDIQDRSPSRRHRPTVWSLWGEGQAINVGDALFAVSQLAVAQSSDQGVAAEVVLRILKAFNRMTIAIVNGQTLDLSFEGRDNVTSAEYLQMIAGKTAAIVQFATWAGALFAGASEDVAEECGTFGLALGLGFQIQDDILGIWGKSEATGKAAADDIRRRKQSLPILMVRERASALDRAELDAIYAQREVDAPGVARVLELLQSYDVRQEVEMEMRRHHDQARDTLTRVPLLSGHPAGRRLFDLVTSLAVRAG